MFLSNNLPVFAISEFQQQAYCEVQLKYKWKGIRVTTQAMIQGSKQHKTIENKFLEETKHLPETTVEKALELAKQGVSSIARELFINSPNFRLRGKIDQIEITPQGIIILDDKPSDYAHFGSKVQLFMYAIAFKDFYRPDLDMMVRIRHRDKGEIIWEDTLTEEIHEEMMERLQRMTELALGQREFEPTKNPKKCQSCGYRYICEHKTTQSGN